MQRRKRRPRFHRGVVLVLFDSTDAQHQHFFGYEVVLRPGVYGAYGDDGRIEWRGLSRHDRLQSEHCARGDDDWVNRRFRTRAVSTTTKDFDIERVGIGQDWPSAVA